MKKILVVVMSFFTCFVIAQTVAPSKIAEVTVYRNNAMIVSEAGVQLKAGTQEIVISNVSTSINPSSLQVSIKGKSAVSLLSAKYENNYLQSPEQHPKIKLLQDSLKTLDYELRWLRDQKAIFLGMEDILNKNKSLASGDGSFKPTDVNVLVDNYKTKLLDIKLNLISLEQKETALQEKRTKVANQLTEANAQFNKPSGEIVLQVATNQPDFANFKISYTVSGAGWSPIYDLRSEGTDKPVSLAYKANVYQNTGFDWERVKLTVSTGNPTQNNNRPVLSTQYVDVFEPVLRMETQSLSEVVIAGAPKKARVMDNLAYSGYSDAYQYDAVTTETQMNVEFALSLPQSIPSNGKQHLVGLESYQLQSVYDYHAVPKLDKGAFLLAKVSNWAQYNLLPGSANIFFEGAYVGQSYINPNQTADTLLLSMGRDERVQIKRKEVNEFTSTKFIGSNKTQTFTYEIEVKNNKGFPISIEILDQLPVSRNKLIEVKPENLGGGKLTEENGKLEWLVNLAPGQSKKFTFSYTVKSPKDMIISGL